MPWPVRSAGRGRSRSLLRLIGPFPYSGLTHVEAITPYGGMENATAIFYNDNLYRARTLPEQTVAHEIAHQWFGDAVTEDDWHHLWLSEGFATYLSQRVEADRRPGCTGSRHAGRGAGLLRLA